MNDIALSWLGGILDGEGCITISRYPKKSCVNGFSFRINVQVATRDSIIAFECFKITQLGRVYSTQTKGKSLNSWITEGHSAYKVLKMVFPFLKLKQNQAQYVIDFFEQGQKDFKQYHSYYPKEVWEYRENCWLKLKEIKKQNYV